MINKKDIINSLKKAQNGNILIEEVYSDENDYRNKNEFLFFIKPEITDPNTNIDVGKILDIIIDRIDHFKLKVHNCKILSAKYLDEYNIISKHYDVINKIANNAKHNMSDSAKEKFFQIQNKKVEKTNILGGFEFLDEYQKFNSFSLDCLWQNKQNTKLASGTYCIDVKIDDDVIYLVNGFHPRQLEHFTEEGKSIIIMTLSGDLSWKEARNEFIGSTNPNNAALGSLRREFLDKKDKLRLPEVSQGKNGVHLSAGPVEALIELKRYNSDYTNQSKIKSIEDFSFGKKLLSKFTQNQIKKIIQNYDVIIDGEKTSVFDITEEQDSDIAIKTLKKYM